MKSSYRFWLLIFLCWMISTWIDRIWWQNYSGVPAWDQADYLNNALDHGRALGILPGGQWQGLKALLDLSPKIPPLASIINGGVIALAGDAPQQAAWSLSLWHGILLFSVASWGIHLRGEVLGLLGTLLVAIAPAFLQLRSNYILEMPLTAIVTTAVWRIGCWWHPSKGGKWSQAIIAAIFSAAAILVKQSALLILIPPIICSSITALSNSRKQKLQLLLGFGIVVLSILPWLNHNWITTISGTQRAVIESAAIEGDPSLLSLENWIWYLKILPEQISLSTLILGLSGVLLWGFTTSRKSTSMPKDIEIKDDYTSWKWLILTIFAGWFTTSLSPNKDYRYITPLLPAILLLLSRGWLQWGMWIHSLWPKSSRINLGLALVSGLATTIPFSWEQQLALLNQSPKGPLKDIIEETTKILPHDSKQTLIVVPSTPDLNQHNVSYFGRRNGRHLIGRQLGNRKSDHEPVLNQAEWIILAEGDQGSVQNSALSLDRIIRSSGIFVQVRQFPRRDGGSYSLWRRDINSPLTKDFATDFPKIANKLRLGPKGLEVVFKEIAVQHMLDGHFKYREPVLNSARKNLIINPKDSNSRWSLALLSILQNRPDAAAKQFEILEKLLPDNPWPSIYHSLMHLAQWNPWKAANIASEANKRNKDPVLEGLEDFNSLIGGAIWKFSAASKSIPNALEAIDMATNSES